MKKENYSPWNLFLESAEKYKDNIMLIYNDINYTYAQMYEKILAFSKLIEKYEFTVGGVFLPNCTEFITSLFALNKQKKTFVSLSYQFKDETLIDLTNFTDIELLITDSKGYSILDGHFEELNIRVVFLLKSAENFEIVEFPRKAGREIKGINEDTFGIVFTSGSTSRPKGIVLSNYAITGNALTVAEYLNFSSDEKTIIPRTLAQASPISGDVLMAVSRGGGIILMNNVFHPAIFLKTIQQYKATNFFTVRTMLQQVLQYPQFGSYDLSSVKRIMLGGMINPQSIFIETARKFPQARVFNAYGSSEASARVAFGEYEGKKSLPYAIGKPMRGCKLKIYKDDNREAQPGEIGEIYIESDYIMDGYYKSEELTKEALTANGFRVKDVGYMDENGMFYILSRSDDMIIQGGSKAYPIDIEEVLLKNPGVKEAAVIGLDDEKLGQKIVSFVCIKPEHKVEVKDLYKWCVQKLEDKKVPKEIYIVENIPRNAVGKISKADIKEMYKTIVKDQNAA